MVPKEFRKNFSVIVGWISLLEALVWGAASIYTVGVYGCSWNFFHVSKGPNTWSMLYVTYLMGGCQGDTAPQDIGFNLTPPTVPAQHLHIWLWVSTVISVTWVPACILLTVAASLEVRGRQGALLYYPWIVISTVIVILDLGGAIYHFIDFVQSTTPDHYASLTSDTSWTNLTMNASSEGVTPWLPSLLVTFFFCRFLILWIVNIIFLYGVYRACTAVSLYTTNYLQSSMIPEENQKSWKNMFFQGPDPSLFDHKGHNEPSSRHNQSEIRSRGPHPEQQRHRTDELRPSDREVVTDPYEEERGPPFRPSVFDFAGRPVRSDSFRDQQWRNNNNAPPIASGVQVPPELNKNEPFSYIAGDQPQKMKRPVSRSNSRGDRPPIPRPDYTIADRSSASLEYVPNRFRVPSPKRHLETTGRPSKVVPAVPKKPTVYPRSIPEEHEMRYVTQPAATQQPGYYTRQASAQDYSINKLY